MFVSFCLFKCFCSAFVAPADIQALTTEAKSKLLARCRGKTVKDFARAVKEICDAFEGLQQTDGEHVDRTAPGCVTSHSGREDGKHPGHPKIALFKDDTEIPVQRESDKNEDPDNEDMECSSPTVSEHVKDGVIQYTEHNASPVLTVKEETKGLDEGAHSPNNGTVSKTKPVLYSSPGKREICSEKTDGNGEEMIPDHGMLEAHSKGSDPTERVGRFDVKDDSPSAMVDPQDKVSSPLALSFHTQNLSEQRVMKKTHRKKKVVSESRKFKSAVEVQKKMHGVSNSSLEHPESGECMKDENMYKMQGKITLCSSVKQTSSFASKADDADAGKNANDVNAGKKANDVSIGKKSNVVNGGKKANDVNSGKKTKSFPRGKKQSVRADNSHVRDSKKTTLGDVEKGIVVGLSSADCSRIGAMPTNGKHKMTTTDDLRAAKKSRPGAWGDDTDKMSALVGIKSDSACTTSVEGKVDELLEMKKPRLTLNAENHALLKVEACGVDSKSIVGDDAALPLTKRCRAWEATHDCSTKAAGNAAGKVSGFCKKDKLSSGYDKSPTRIRSRRRQCFPFDEDGETQRKTPVHRGSASILKTAPSYVLDPIPSINLHQENPCHSQSGDKDVINEGSGSARPDDRSSKNMVSTVNIVDSSLTGSPRQTEEKRLKNAIESHFTISPRKQESRRSSSDGKPVLKDLPGSVSAAKPLEHKVNRPQVKPSSTSALQKMHGGSSKGSGLAAESLNQSRNLVMAQINKPNSLSEKLEVTPKTIPRMNATSENRSDHAGSAKRSSEKDILHGERYVDFVWLTGTIIDNGLSLLLLSYYNYVHMFVFSLLTSLSNYRVEVAKSDKASRLSNDSKFSESSTSMKHLIAAAQAKRREAHSQSLAQPNAFAASVPTPPAAQERSPNPVSAVQPFSSGNVLQHDKKGLYANTSLASPSPQVHQLVPQNQIDAEEYEDGRVSSGRRARGGSLSGGTEAVVARDAFEGMIETLSRTKESIGRATRLAIDCAKYGIAGEVS